MYFALIQGLGFQMSIAKTLAHSRADRKRMFGMYVKAIA
jgi:hypothetical protein